MHKNDEGNDKVKGGEGNDKVKGEDKFALTHSESSGEDVSRRGFIGRLSTLGLLSVSGSLLIHDVSAGSASPQDGGGTGEDPADCTDSCYCHCTCECTCACGCDCTCSCGECSCKCIVPRKLKTAVSAMNKVNAKNAAINTNLNAVAGRTIDKDQGTNFVTLEHKNRATQLDTNKDSISAALDAYIKDSKETGK